MLTSKEIICWIANAWGEPAMKESYTSGAPKIWGYIWGR